MRVKVKMYWLVNKRGGKGEIDFSAAEIHMMKTMYRYKFTMRQIADKFMCSQGTVSKLISR